MILTLKRVPGKCALCRDINNPNCIIMKLKLERQDIKHARRKDAIIAICEKYMKPHNVFENMKRRHRPDVQMRQLVMYLLKEFTDMPFLDIGTVFKKDHATAVHACKQMEIFV